MGLHAPASPRTVPHEHLCSDLMSFKNPDCERLLDCPLEPLGCFQSPIPFYSLWLFTGRTEVTGITKLPPESQHVARARTLGPLKSPKNEARLVHYRGGQEGSQKDGWVQVQNPERCSFYTSPKCHRFERLCPVKKSLEGSSWIEWSRARSLWCGQVRSQGYSFKESRLCRTERRQAAWRNIASPLISAEPLAHLVLFTAPPGRQAAVF